METLRVWNYPQFKSYLQDLTKGNNYLIPAADYPDRLDLSKDWHEILDQMRQDSTDGLERLVLISHRRVNNGIYVPTNSVIGSPELIETNLIREAITKLKKDGMTGFVGIIHSHPSELYRERKHLRGLIKTKEKVGNVADLSPYDLYWMADPNRFLPFSGVVEGNDTLFAFKTRESVDIPFSNAFFNQKAFVAYWLSQGISAGNISQAIAQRHKYVFYRFGSKEQLVKTFIPTIA